VKLDKVFTDKSSGKDTARPQMQAALEYLREGDLFMVHSMDRLARNLDDLRRIVLDLTEKGVHVQFAKENLTFTGEDSPMTNLLLTLLGAVAEFERSLIRERQREGIALAKEAGVYKGRKPSLTPVQVAEIRKRVEACGAQLLYLPPYSLDLNSIEKAWSKFKKFLRDAKARTKEALDQAVTNALNTITADNALNTITADNAAAWFRHCGYGTQQL
jgi:DNA invertase Pin-like site-specific DNA recombinase